jgi:hypothetical protein
MAEEIQTSEETLSEETSEETEGEQTPPVDYEAKFAASTKEAQRLLNETKRLESEVGEERATRQRLEAELKSYYDTLKEQNPEAFDLNSVKKSLDDIQKRIAIREETEELNTFVNSNPEAGSHREALKALGRSMPKTPYSVIWDKYFKPLIEKGEEEYAKNLQIKKRTQPETGKGAITEEPSEISKTEFNNLPLDRQKAYLKKMGVKFENEMRV